MSKVCKNCGYVLQDDALFCFSCGTKVDRIAKPDVEDLNSFAQAVQPEPVEPVVNEEPSVPFTGAESNYNSDNNYNFGYNTPVTEEKPIVESQPTQPAEISKPKKSKGKGFWIKLIALFVVLAVIAVGVVLYVVDDINNKNAINKAVDKFVDAIYLGEIDLVDDMIPEDYEDKLNEELDDWGADNEEIYALRSENLDELFGDDITIKYEITDFERVPCFNEYYYIDIIERGHGIRVDEIEKIYRVRFNVSISGSEDEDVYSHKMAAIKFDDEWQLLDLDSGCFAYVYSVTQWLEIDPTYEY